MLDASLPISNLNFNRICTPNFKLYQHLRLVFVIECKMFKGRSELLHQAHMSVIIYCHDKTINLVRHPNSKAEKSAIAGIQTRVPDMI